VALDVLDRRLAENHREILPAMLGNALQFGAHHLRTL
jgi:hypothetical protein